MGQMMKVCKEEFDRLGKCPDEDEEIIKRFKNEFKHSPEFKKISKPEICDELISISKFTFDDKDLALSKQDVEKYRKRKQLMGNVTKINNFKKTFVELQGREPSKAEVIDHFDDFMNINQLHEALDSIEKTGIEMDVV